MRLRSILHKFARFISNIIDYDHSFLGEDDDIPRHIEAEILTKQEMDTLSSNIPAEQEKSTLSQRRKAPVT